MSFLRFPSSNKKKLTDFTHATASVDLKGITLSEKSQPQQATNCMNYQNGRILEMENRLVVTRRQKREMGEGVTVKGGLPAGRICLDRGGAFRNLV